jgi:vacuolar-type H+-ATPase subunit H
VADDKLLEELRVNQEVVEHDAASPLHRIREKEIEISGRVMSAKQQADEIVAEARKRAAKTLAKAEVEGERLAREREEKALAEAERDAAAIREQAVADAVALEASLASRCAAAAQAVVKAVTEV